MKYLCYTHIGGRLEVPVWIVVAKGNLKDGGTGYVVSTGFYIPPGDKFEFGAEHSQSRLKNRRFLYDDTADEVPDEAIAAYTRAILEGKIREPRSNKRAA